MSVIVKQINKEVNLTGELLKYFPDCRVRDEFVKYTWVDYLEAPNGNWFFNKWRIIATKYVRWETEYKNVAEIIDKIYGECVYHRIGDCDRYYKPVTYLVPR